MNTKYSNWKMWYYVLCMVLTLQLAACSEETHDEYTAAPEIEDTYIDQLDALIAEMTDLQQNSDYGDKKGQYPTESRAILTDAIDDANRAVLLIKYQQPSPSESEKQRYVAEAKASIEQFKSTIRTEDAETTPAELFVDGRGDGGSYIDFGRSEEYVNFGTEGNQAFTVEFWVKVTKGGGKDQNVFLSTYMGGDGWRNGWMMYWRNADGGIYRATWGETGGNICEPSLKAPEDGEWQHFLFVYSDKGLPGSPELRAKLYVNGEVKTTEGSVGSRFYNSSNYANYNAPMTAFGRYMRTSDNLFEEGGFWHKKIYPHQMWLDGIYMGSPFYAEYAMRNSRVDDYQDVIRQFKVVARHTYDPATGLYKHAWDESRQQKWADPVTGQSAHCWGRAMGWYAMALVDVLDYIPVSEPGRDSLLVILNHVATQIEKYQDKRTGLWYQVVDRSGDEGNYLEASASAMYAYALMKGVQKGYLPSSLMKVGVKGYKGILEHLIQVDDKGLVTLTQICEVAGLGGSKNYRMGDYDYYINEKKKDNDAKGVGPFILASLEYEKYIN